MSKVESFIPNKEFLGKFFRKELELDVPEQLKALRKMRGISQENLAKQVGINQPTISRLEREFKEGQSVEYLIRLSEALGARLHITLEPYELAAAKIKAEGVAKEAVSVQPPKKPRIMPKGDPKPRIEF